MQKILFVIGILIVIFVFKMFFKAPNRDSQEYLPPTVMSKSSKDDCMPMDKFLAEYPDATPEEMYKVELCNRERAERLGLDKPNTGFLGNTYSPPNGALAHYEGSGSRMFFTVYDDHILANGSKGYSDDTEIPFSAVKAVEKAWDVPGTINIEYETEQGSIMQYSITILGTDDMMKAEGATDLDRLIALLEKQKGKFQE